MDLPRVPLILAPTPLHRMPRLSEELGIELWIKRDDLTGFALGGNKGRKLEYLIADALRQRADTVVSCGSIQSNFIRQLGAACAMHGLKCHAAVMALPYLSAEVKPTEGRIGLQGGNVLLDELLGVKLHVLEDGTWDELYESARSLADLLRKGGAKVYEVPVGGSSALGAFAFYRAGRELISQQESPFDWIVFASSSGSTHTGLEYAFRGQPTRVLGIACDPEPDILDDFQALYGELEALVGERKRHSRNDWQISFDFVGAGYGVSSPLGNEAIRRVARSEGIFLDPVYTGKAFSGLLALSGAGEIGGRVCFWHTGGVPALFAS